MQGFRQPSSQNTRQRYQKINDTVRTNGLGIMSLHSRSEISVEQKLPMSTATLPTQIQHNPSLQLPTIHLLKNIRQLLHLRRLEMRLDNSALGELQSLDRLAAVSHSHTLDCLGLGDEELRVGGCDGFEVALKGKL